MGRIVAPISHTLYPIYNYGHVLLDLLSGKHVQFSHALDLIKGKNILLLLDSFLKGQCANEDSNALVDLASRCLHYEARVRPDIMEFNDYSHCFKVYFKPNKLLLNREINSDVHSWSICHQDIFPNSAAFVRTEGCLYLCFIRVDSTKYSDIEHYIHDCFGVGRFRKTAGHYKEKKNLEATIVFHPGDLDFFSLNLEDNSVEVIIFSGISTAFSFWYIVSGFFFYYQGSVSNHYNYHSFGDVNVPQNCVATFIGEVVEYETESIEIFEAKLHVKTAKKYSLELDLTNENQRIDYRLVLEGDFWGATVFEAYGCTDKMFDRPPLKPPFQFRYLSHGDKTHSRGEYCHEHNMVKKKCLLLVILFGIT